MERECAGLLSLDATYLKSASGNPCAGDQESFQHKRWMFTWRSLPSIRKTLIESAKLSWMRAVVVSRRSSLFNEKTCSLLSTRTFCPINLSDESILRIHSHLECSRVKEFTTLYDMYNRIRMGLLRPLLQLLLTGTSIRSLPAKCVPLRLHSPTAHGKRTQEFITLYDMSQFLMESYGWKIIIAIKTCES